MKISSSTKRWATVVALFFVSSSYVIAADSDSQNRFPSDPAAQRELLRNTDDMVRRMPDDYRIYGMRASLLERLGEYDKAMPEINKANDLHPHDPQILNVRADLYVRNKSYNLALEDYSQAIELQPSALLYANRAAIYLCVNKLSEARADAERAMKLDSSMSTPYEALGEVYYKTGHYAEAIAYLSAAIKRDEANSGDAYFYRGKSYERLGKRTQASEDMTRAAHLGFKEGVFQFIMKDK